MLQASIYAWRSLYGAHKDNKKHYGFFENNAFRGKDKLMQIYGEKVATGKYAALPGKRSRGDNDSTASDNSDSSDSEAGLSTSSSRRPSKKRPRVDVQLGDEVEETAISWSNSEHSSTEATDPDPFGLDREGNEIDSTRASKTPSTRQSTPAPKSSKKKKDKKARTVGKDIPADEQPQREGVKRERSSADKIKAGLDGLAKQAD